MPIHSVLCIVFLPYLACYTLSPQVNYTSTPVCCPLHITPHTLCPIRSTHPLTIRCLLYIVPHACPIHYFLHQLPYIDSYTLPPMSPTIHPLKHLIASHTSSPIHHVPYTVPIHRLLYATPYTSCSRRCPLDIRFYTPYPIHCVLSVVPIH